MVEKVARSISCLALMEEIMNIIYEKWDEILETVKTEHELSDVSFKTWLKPLTIHSIDDQMVTILVPSQQVGLNYISKKYALPLKVAISELTGSDYDIKFVLPEDIQNVEKEVPVSTNYNTSMEMANLNPKYTFDTFVVGSNNKFAHAASLAVAESPGEIYNPLFLYGGVGLGKTHLMHSVAHFILERNPSTKILYTTSEEFTNELIEAIRNGNNTAMTKFREKYRNIDVLLIDDIQFIIGKESTQEEFFHTFNALHSAKINHQKIWKFSKIVSVLVLNGDCWLIFLLLTMKPVLRFSGKKKKWTVTTWMIPLLNILPRTLSPIFVNWKDL